MRIVYFRLLNYAGIYNGMGINELKIDFAKCNHVITMISGKNGVGKSTLLKSLNPLPDGSENFLDKLPVEKEIVINDNGNIYRLLIQSPVTSNGNRSGTKAFISKNGNELNTTGNVTSYKEILFSEFELDSNYIALSKLSSDDRGLADKTPAERKKFVGSILSSIDAYNEIYKNLSKKANTYKTFINNISTKIKNLGNEEILHNRLVEIESEQKRLTAEKEKYEKQKADEEAYIKVSDPDGKIQEHYKTLYDAIKEINNNINRYQNSIDGMVDKCKHYLQSDNYDKERIRINKLLTEYIKNIESAKAKLSINISKIEDLIKEIDIDNGKLQNMKNGFEIENLQNSVRILEDNVISAQNNLASSKISLEGLSRTELDTILNTLTNIVSNIKVIYERYSADEFYALNDLDTNGSNHIESLNNFEQTIYNYMEIIHTSEMEISQIDSRLDELNILKDRPKACKIDTCPFISSVLSLDKKKLESRKKELKKDIETANINIENTKVIIDKLRTSINICQDVDSIYQQIENSKLLLNKIPETVIFTDYNEFIVRISRLDLFSEVDSIRKYYDYLDTSESLKIDKDRLKEFKSELKVLESKQEAINLLQESVDKKNNEVIKLREDNKTINSDISFNENLKSEYENILSTLDNIIDYNLKIKDLQTEKDSRVKEYRKIEDSIKTIKQYIDHINELDSKLNNIKHDLDPLQSEKENTNFALTSIQTYYDELSMYQEKFNTINTLKKYSSPTSGIQTIYMEMYMGKTLSMANQLLGMLFNGEYQLLPYIINENEFRIPFIGNGMSVDDISSGSTSQICMIGMIMNLVLLFQASNKYNIVFLDEIDGGLDTLNRGLFINTLYQLIHILNIDQLIMISHNIESDLSNVDLIKLKSNEDDSNDYRNVNVIFDYEKDVRRIN